jgi:hypothetical protein
VALIRLFFYSAGVLLGCVGVAKVLSSLGSAPALELPDPVLLLPMRHVLFTVGLLETVVALVCLHGKRLLLSAGLVAWLGTCFMVYRICLLMAGYSKPCHCLGNLTEAAGVSPEVADMVMKGVMLYLVAGSYGALFVLRRANRNI